MKWLVPEIVQTSQMDCGPAALAAVADGLGVPLNYARLREACATGVGGTSIDAILEIAQQFGLDADQIMLPVEHVSLREAQALPAIVVALQATGGLHFVVVWRRVAGFIQVMDPTSGRRWVRSSALSQEVFRHEHGVSEEQLAGFVRSPPFVSSLCRRMSALGFSPLEAARRADLAAQGDDWFPMAALDAGVRFVSSIASERGVRIGGECVHAVDAARERALRFGRERFAEALPKEYWFANEDASGPRVRGAVMVSFSRSPSRRVTASTEPSRYRVSTELVDAILAPGSSPLSAALKQITSGNTSAVLSVALSTAAAATAVLFQSVLLRAAISSYSLPTSGGRAAAAGAIIAWLGGTLALEIAAGALGARLGRRLEASIRIAFYRKLPRLEGAFFESRLSSDMAERAHVLHAVGTIPQLLKQITAASAMLIGTTAGIIWLDPGLWAWAALLALASLILPMLAQPFLVERDLKFRTYQGAATRHYLDAMLGSTPIRAHTAERTIRREHDILVAEQAVAARALLSAGVVVQLVLGIVRMSLVTLVLWAHFSRTGSERGDALLMMFWVLQIPAYGKQLADAYRRYPSLRNVLLRVFEPLTAPETPSEVGAAGPDATRPSRTDPVGIEMQGVTVELAGRPLLLDVTATIPAGAHTAIVGESGSGKSTFLGILLGWHIPSAGRLTIDGRPLTAMVSQELRAQTAWVAPDVAIWNRSVLDNIRFGNRQSQRSVADAVRMASLLPLVASLPGGLQAVTGEGGRLLSGGEGQRLRFGRALLRWDVRLALLDEPFRGLARDQRKVLLAAARKTWSHATLLCATHDVDDTTTFDIVLVIDRGRVVEMGAPTVLLAKPSRYRAMLLAECAKERAVTSAAPWRHVDISNGSLRENEE